MLYANEDKIGEALKELFDEGTVKREEMYIVSKVWNTYHKREKVIECCKISLKLLGLDYLDLYLIHWPVAFVDNGEMMPKDESGNALVDDNVDYLETWQGMEDCYNAGLVKSIGLSNFNIEQTERILSVCKIKPVMNQVECHPYLAQEDLRKYSAEHGILLTAYSPLGRPSYAPGKDLPAVLKEPLVIELARKYNRTVAQILIRFIIQRGIVCIPKSVNPERLKENMNVFDFKLTDEDLHSLLQLNRNQHYIRNQFFSHSKHFPF